jgi:NAD(P)-dependent dehydrogenase (short-subunit alcohol dehydrogenase family)
LNFNEFNKFSNESTSCSLQICCRFILAFENAQPSIVLLPGRPPDQPPDQCRIRSGRVMMLNRIPPRRFGTAAEMAGAVRCLASPPASYITGQVLLLDGGLTAY